MMVEEKSVRVELVMPEKAKQQIEAVGKVSDVVRDALVEYFAARGEEIDMNVQWGGARKQAGRKPKER